MEIQKEILLEEELAKFKSSTEAFKDIESKLASSSHHLAMVTNNHNKLLSMYSDSLLSVDSIQSELVDKYGQGIMIDVKTGEIIRNNESNS
jgi:hypothetical protein